MELAVLFLPELVEKEPLVPWRSEIVGGLSCVELPDTKEPFNSAKVVACMSPEPFCTLVVE